MKGLYHKWIAPDGLKLIKKWKLDGMTNDDIAERIGISRKTLYEWANRFSDFSDALKESREIVVKDLVDTLVKRATGFVGPDNKYYPPSDTALIFALKNMDSLHWREKREVQAELDEHRILISAPEEWAK